MIGGVTLYLGSWDQHASCISTSKVGRRQPISLRFNNIQEDEAREGGSATLALDGWLDVLCSGKAMRVFIGVHQGVNGL